MDIKRKTCDVRYWNKISLDISSTNIDTLVPSLYQFVETRSSKVFWLFSQPLPHLVGHHLRLSNVPERISRPSCEPFYATNTSQRKQKTFLYEYPLHWVIFALRETQNRTLLFGITLLKHGRHFDYWNQPLNMRMRINYLDCHEAGLCCYLVIHIENLLRPLQLFCLHLWSIYWLSLVAGIGLESVNWKVRVFATLICSNVEIKIDTSYVRIYIRTFVTKNHI
jgi:hypothetical protein